MAATRTGEFSIAAFGEYYCDTDRESISEVLRISARKVDRVKRRFVEEGLEAALGGRQGRRPRYLCKADGEFEARLVALSCGQPPAGHAQWSLRLLADRVVELGYIESVSHETVRRVLKNDLKPWRRVGWVIPPQHNADFVAGIPLRSSWDIHSCTGSSQWTVGGMA